MNSTTIIIPKESTFKLPQGHYPAQVTQFKVKEVSSAKGKSQSATILFEVWVPGMENYECIARKVVPLDLKAGSVMRRFLEGLLGDSYLDVYKRQEGQPVGDALGRLVGGVDHLGQFADGQVQAVIVVGVDDGQLLAHLGVLRMIGEVFHIAGGQLRGVLLHGL